MSFLLGRRSTSRTSPTTNNSRQVLYDASESWGESHRSGGSSGSRRDVSGGGHNNDGDDELEAAFGGDDDDAYDDADGDAPELGRFVRHPRDTSVRSDPDGNDEHARPEEAALLSPSATDSGPSNTDSSTSNRPGLARNNSSGTGAGYINPNPGGYDFERDPYERSRTVVRPASGSTSRRTSRRSSIADATRLNTQYNGQPGATGILATLQNALPSRWRRYGLLNNGNSGVSASSGRRNDGTADHGDEEDDDDEWAGPPPSMPGLFGGGTRNDGVFSNLMAKPGGRPGPAERRDVLGGDDDAPEKEIPPAYEMAVLDSAPPYFDTTVHAPGGGGYLSGAPSNTLDEILVEGLPIGSIFSFFWSLLVSMSFQFVGFLLTTMLSTSHAAKNGSRAGLGITLIQYGLFLQNGADEQGQREFVVGGTGGQEGKDEWADFWGDGGGNGNGNGDGAVATATAAVVRQLAASATSSVSRALESGVPSLQGNGTQPVLVDGTMAVSGLAGSWLSMVLMIGGWFLLVSSVTAHIKAIRYAKALRDGGASDPDSLAEIGGPVAWFQRLTGREVTRPERRWGLPSRPMPQSAIQTSSPTSALGSGVPPQSAGTAGVGSAF